MTPLTIQEQIVSLRKDIETQQIRTNRVVSVLLKNLPRSALNTKINFMGKTCHGIPVYSGYANISCYHDNRMTLRDFLLNVIDP